MDATPLFKPAPQPATEPAPSFAKAPRKYLPGRLIDTYIFGHVAEATARGMAMFIMLLLFFAVITATRKMLDNSLSGAGAAQLILYQLPRIFLFTLPMSTLYGTLHAFGELSTHREIIGMWGGGMSFKRMLIAPLIWGALLSICSLAVQELVVPAAETRKDKILANQFSQSTSVITNIDKTLTGRDGSQTRLMADEFDARARTLLNPRLVKTTAKGDAEGSLRADTAKWNDSAKRWDFIKPYFRSWTQPSQQANSGAATISTESASAQFDAPSPEMLGKPALTREQNLLKHNFEFVSISDLLSWQAATEAKSREPGLKEAERRDWRKEASSATYAIHDKIVTPLICLSLVLIGAPLGLRPQRSAGGFSFGLSMIVLLLYYVVWTWANQVGRGGVVNPYVMAYLPLVLTAGAGTVLSWQKSR